MNPRPTRGASCSTVAWANSASTAPAAFTCIFHLSSRGVALLGSTYNPPSNPPTRSSNDVTSSSKLPLAASYRRDRKPAVAATATAAVVFYYFTYLPYDDGGCGGDRCMRSFSLLFFCYILAMLHARTRPGGRSPRSYLCYIVPIIFLLFHHRCLHRVVERTAGQGKGGSGRDLASLFRPKQARGLSR